MLRSNLFLPGLVLVLAGGALAQGDDCSTATALAGTGAFTFDTTTKTTSSFGGGICSLTINQDAFGQWMAPAAGDYSFGTSWDT
ncbi:MAG: hypothetical protein ACI9F9_000089 [Candidatus Paceibacteria bacterium]|jgi:hypothetical protein